MEDRLAERIRKAEDEERKRAAKEEESARQKSAQRRVAKVKQNIRDELFHEHNLRMGRPDAAEPMRSSNRAGTYMIPQDEGEPTESWTNDEVRKFRNEMLRAEKRVAQERLLERQRV